MPNVRMTFIHATFALVTFVHISNIFPNFCKTFWTQNFLNTQFFGHKISLHQHFLDLSVWFFMIQPKYNKENNTIFLGFDSIEINLKYFMIVKYSIIVIICVTYLGLIIINGHNLSYLCMLRMSEAELFICIEIFHNCPDLFYVSVLKYVKILMLCFNLINRYHNCQSLSISFHHFDLPKINLNPTYFWFNWSI